MPKQKQIETNVSIKYQLDSTSSKTAKQFESASFTKAVGKDVKVILKHITKNKNSC